MVIIDVYNNKGKFLVRFSNKFTQARCRVPLPSNPDLLSHANNAKPTSLPRQAKATNIPHVFLGVKSNVESSSEL